jgi:hypothetical protein
MYLESSWVFKKNVAHSLAGKKQGLGGSEELLARRWGARGSAGPA